MSLSTTRTRLTTVIGAITGITGGAGKVHNRIRDDLDRADAESDLMGSAGINCWECEVVPEAFHGGASAQYRTGAKVRIRAHYKADDANASFNAFCDLIEAVALALMDPTSGFPQIAEGGVRVSERPSVPVKLRTAHSAFRAVLEADLWDVVNT